MEFWDGYIEFKKKIAIGEQGKLLKEEDFRQYAENFGPQRALGYIDALNDFTAYAETILGGGYCRNGVPESNHMVKKNLTEFVKHNQKLLNLINPKSGINSHIDIDYTI